MRWSALCQGSTENAYASVLREQICVEPRDFHKLCVAKVLQSLQTEQDRQTVPVAEHLPKLRVSAGFLARGFGATYLRDQVRRCGA